MHENNLPPRSAGRPAWPRPDVCRGRRVAVRGPVRCVPTRAGRAAALLRGRAPTVGRVRIWFRFHSSSRFSDRSSARRCLQRQVWQGETDDASALEMQRSSALSTWRGEDFGLTVIVGGSDKSVTIVLQQPVRDAAAGAVTGGALANLAANREHHGGAVGIERAVEVQQIRSMRLWRSQSVGLHRNHRHRMQCSTWCGDRSATRPFAGAPSQVPRRGRVEH